MVSQHLGGVTQFFYKQNTGSDSQFKVRTYEYRCNKLKHWVFEMHKSVRVEDGSCDDEECARSDDEDDIEDTLEDGEPSVDDIREVQNGMEWSVLDNDVEGEIREGMVR